MGKMSTFSTPNPSNLVKWFQGVDFSSEIWTEVSGTRTGFELKTDGGKEG